MAGSQIRLWLCLLLSVYAQFNGLSQVLSERYAQTDILDSNNLSVWKDKLEWKTRTNQDVWVQLHLYARSDQSVLKITGYYESVALCTSANCLNPQWRYPVLTAPDQPVPQTVIFNLPTIPSADTTFFLKITKAYSKPSIEFFTESAYIHSTEKEIFVNALFCGLILAMIVITFYYFLTERKVLFRCYTMYLIFLLLSSAIHLNTVTEFLLNLFSNLIDRPDVFLIGVIKTVNLAALLTALRFGYVFFELKSKSYLLSLVFKIQAFITLLAYLYIFFTPVPQHKAVVFGITILTFIVLITTSGFLWIKYQRRSYLIYIAAYILFFTGYLTNILTIAKVSSYSPGFFIGGVMIETLLLSYALVVIITEEKSRTKTSLIKTTEELLSRINEFERFSSILAHNLRAPIARLLGLVNLLTSKSLKDSQEIINLLGKAGEDLDLTVKKIRQILDLKKEQITLFEPVNIKETLNKLYPKINEKIKETNAELNISLTGNEAIIGNKDYVSSILCNILENCFKFREPSRKLKVDITSRTDDHYVYVTIKDNGSGFPLNEVNDKLFEPFQRFHTNVEGKGLGLYLAKVQIEKLGGEIMAESIPGKGTIVTLKLPKNIKKLKKEFYPLTPTPDFTLAKEKHLEWMYRIKKLLDGEKNAISLDAAISHYQCDLGKWFYGEGKVKFGHIKAIQEFEKEHILLHMLTKEIIMSLEEGNVKAANEQFMKLQITSENLLKILTEVEKIVYTHA